MLAKHRFGMVATGEGFFGIFLKQLKTDEPLGIDSQGSVFFKQIKMCLPNTCLSWQQKSNYIQMSPWAGSQGSVFFKQTQISSWAGSQRSVNPYLNAWHSGLKYWENYILGKVFFPTGF